MKLEEKVLSYKEDVVKHIQGSVRIKSVEEPSLPNMPFGEGPKKALEYFIKLGQELGFKVTNYDNYVATIEFGEGEEVLAILGHVDVVPEGEDWDYPPYSGTIADGKIYGRGTLDDKGPSVVVLYAMKALLDSGIKLNKKVKMILGANEETGNRCMDYYFNVLKMPQPTLAFTPDSTFPVTFAEKGIVNIKFLKEYKSLNEVTLKAGNAFNSVPDRAILTIPREFLGEIKECLEKYNMEKEYKIQCEVVGDKYEIKSQGKSAHGAMPYLGYNAISHLFEFLSSVEIKNSEFKELVEFFSTYIKNETDGNSLGIKSKDDESGELTLNLGKGSLENGKLELCVDMRIPVLIDNLKIVEDIKAKVNGKMNVELCKNAPPLYVPKDSFLVSTLMKVYQDVTGDVKTPPQAIGGGTYARSVTNGVAFGALLSSQIDNMHQRNEYLELDKIDILLKIYVNAIYELAK